MIHYKLTPDHKIDNKSVEKMIKGMNVYRSPLQRWNGKGFDRSFFFSYEVKIKKGSTSFHITIPDGIKNLTEKNMETAYPKATIEPGADPFDFKPDAVHRIELKSHPMFSIRVDRRENGFLPSVLETLRLMGEDDEIFIQVLSLPAPLDWYRNVTDAYKKFQGGKMPKKWHIDGKELTQEGVKMLTRGVLGAVDTMVVLTGGKPEKIDLDESDRIMMMKDGGLRPETLNKPKSDAFDVTIRVAIKSKDHKNLIKMVEGSFREFDGDNRFISYPIDVKKPSEWIKARKPGIKVSKDYLSTPELSRIVHMPTAPIQEKWSIDRIDKTETAIPKSVTESGMLLGTHIHKGSESPVYMPTSDWDELCLPRIVIGGMGQGKTKGYGANLIFQAVQNGFGGIIFDPAKGEVGDELEKVLGPDKIIRINVATTPISLDWCEVSRSKHARNRMANTIISFFNTNGDDAGAQTTRFIRALVMAMQTEKLSEIIKMVYDPKYLQEVVTTMPEGIHRSTIEELNDYSDGRRMQILAPIMNRMDMILGDTFLNECLEHGERFDMVDILHQRKAVVIDVPKKDLGPEGIDVIMNLFTTKLDLAMTLREDQDQFPFFAVFDEPHQYMRSHGLWKSASVESRKWRVGYAWLFHEWTQIDSDLRKVIKSALPHYHIYPSSKDTFKGLSEEIAPFTLEDSMKLQRWHAINVIRSGGKTITPFMAKMTPPPSQQSGIKENQAKPPKTKESITWSFPK